MSPDDKDLKALDSRDVQILIVSPNDFEARTTLILTELQANMNRMRFLLDNIKAQLNNVILELNQKQDKK